MLTAKLILERLDKEGRLLEKREQLARSFLIQFIELLYVAHAQIAYTSPYSMTDIGSNARDIDNQSITLMKANYRKANLMIGSAPGNCEVFAIANILSSSTNAFSIDQTLEGQTIGIQVGTGSTAVTPTDVVMETRIVHGTTAGTFQYGGCEFIDILFSGLSPHDGEFTIRRYFTNASGGSITVNEAGIYAVGTQLSNTTPASWAFLIAHDIVSPGVAVADTELLKVTYVPQITV